MAACCSEEGLCIPAEPLRLTAPDLGLSVADPLRLPLADATLSCEEGLALMAPDWGLPWAEPGRLPVFVTAGSAGVSCLLGVADSGLSWADPDLLLVAVAGLEPLRLPAEGRLSAALGLLATLSGLSAAEAGRESCFPVAEVGLEPAFDPIIKKNFNTKLKITIIVG